MQIVSISNPAFQGNIHVSGLSNKQKQAFDVIYPALEKQIKLIKNINLNISGSLNERIISVCRGKEPRYILMATQVKSCTHPTATSTVKSLKPETILKSAQNLINEHLNSKFYKETVESEKSIANRFLNRIKSFFGINKQQIQ